MPKFGAWDVKDPNAGDGFTMIFQKLSNEKKEGGPVHIPRLNSDQASSHEGSYGKHSHYNGGPRKEQSSSSSVSENCSALKGFYDSASSHYLTTGAGRFYVNSSEVGIMLY